MNTVQGEKTLLKKAVERSRLAPSVHNTQPWHFVVLPDALELHAYNDRQLQALEPTGRQMVISCACALFNAGVALAADRVLQIDRMPDAAQPDFLARVTVVDKPVLWTPLVSLEPVVDSRHTPTGSNRDHFRDRRGTWLLPTPEVLLRPVHQISPTPNKCTGPN